MKALFFILVVTTIAHAKPMQQMDQRLKTYSENEVVCKPGNEIPSDAGLFIDVSCDFQCKGSVPRVERTKGAFLPNKLGLFPGNGSTTENIMWSSLGISLKIWSEKICLEKAVLGCKSEDNIESYGMRELESGAWKMNKFPGCNETGITVSPFNNSTGSVRASELVAKMHYEPRVMQIIDIEEEKQAEGSCKNMIKAKICFGDCLDLNRKDSEIVETISTSEPLGSNDIEICGDKLDAKLKDLKLSASVRKQLCETYFWQTFMKPETDLRNNLYKSCAAIRGETTCDKF
jgi:hypothetical protein